MLKLKILKSTFNRGLYDGRPPFSNYIEASMYLEDEAKSGKDTIIVSLKSDSENQNSVESVVLSDSALGNGYKLISKQKDGKLEIRTYRKIGKNTSKRG